MTEPVRIPSVELMREIVDALHSFLIQGNSRAVVTWVQEDCFLPAFTRLADALRAVRPLIDKSQGWPNRMVRALPTALDGFERVASAWGWERLAEPEPARSTFIEERLNWFREERERPMYEAALSWQAGCRRLEECDPDADYMAEKGRDHGFSPTMTPEEGKARFWDAYRDWGKAPRLGHRDPRLEVEGRDQLSLAHKVFQWGLAEVEKDARAEAANPASPAVVPTNKNERQPVTPEGLPDLVTIDQAAALVNRSHRTLERYKKRGMPKPFVLGGGGKPHEYPWTEMRKWLQKTFNRQIPETAIERFRHPRNAGRH